MGLRVVAVTKSHYLAAHAGQGRADTYTARVTGIPADTNVNFICDSQDSNTLITHC